MGNNERLNIVPAHFDVQICFSLIEEQQIHLLDMRVPEGSSIQYAIKKALDEHQLQEIYPDFKIDNSIYGIFGKKKSLNAILKKGDRIEIYRPLIANPMDARRGRVVKATKINVKQ